MNDKTPERIWAGLQDGYGTWHESYDFVDRVEYIRADLVPQWKPIETAPKDGTHIPLYFPSYHEGKVDVYYFTEGYDYEGSWDGLEGYSPIGDYEDQPTHWMPLPEGPKDDN